MTTFAATYALVWLALAGYVGWMSSRQRRLIEQFTRLRQQFSEAEVSDVEEDVPVRRVA